MQLSWLVFLCSRSSIKPNYALHLLNRNTARSDQTILLFAQSVSLLRTACRKEQHLAILRSSVSMITAGEQKAIQVSPRRLGQGLGCLYQAPCQAQQAREQSLHCTLHSHSLVDGALARWCHRSAQAAAWQDWICSLLVPLTRASRQGP